MKDIQHSTKIKLAIGFSLLVILYTIYSQFAQEKSLKDGVFVKGRVTNLLMARGGLVVYVDYYYQGVKYNGDFLTNSADSIQKNEFIVMKISKEPLGEYMEYVKKADK